MISLKLKALPERKNSKVRRFIYKYYTILIAYVFFAVVIFRTIYVNAQGVFLVPVIYIAILYGFAFIAYVEPKQSFTFYFSMYLIMYYLYPKVHPSVLETTVLQDILANHVVAFMVAVISYNRFKVDFQYKKIIANKNKKLKELSTTDMLTKLPNRRKIDLDILLIHEQSIKNRTRYSLLLVDIDHFKKVNDTYGHSTGDHVLVELAELLKQNIPKEDIIGRWGGEEFIILCKDTVSIDAEKRAEDLKRTIETHEFSTIGHLTCSFGVATYKEGMVVDELFKYADLALYQSKASGRNKVSVYN